MHTKTSTTSSINKKVVFSYVILAVSLIILIILNILLGTKCISPKGFFDALSDKNSTDYIIIFNLRIPRIIAVILVGAGMSVAGLLLQTTLNNSLASPSIVGINSGAGLAVVIISLIIPYSSATSTIATLVGAFLSAMLIYFVAKLTGSSRNKLILAGVAISRLFSAIIDAIVYFNPSALSNRQLFQLGSFAKVTTTGLYISGPIIIVGIIAALFIAKYLDILILGDERATSLGVNVKVIRFIILVIVAMLSAGSVALAGMISFLGLIVPHITRRIFGVENHKRLVISTILFGAALTLACDLISRTAFIPFEIPVGIILSIIGIPFFIYLLFGKGGKRRVVNSHKIER